MAKNSFMGKLKEMHDDITEESVEIGNYEDDDTVNLPEASDARNRAFKNIPKVVTIPIIKNIRNAMKDAQLSTMYNIDIEIWDRYSYTIIEWLKQYNYKCTYEYSQKTPSAKEHYSLEISW